MVYDKVSLQWRVNVQSNVIWFNGRVLRRPAKACLMQLCKVVPAKPIFAHAPKTVCDVMSSFIIRQGSVIRSDRDICDLQWQNKLPCILSESQAIMSGSNFYVLDPLKEMFLCHVNTDIDCFLRVCIQPTTQKHPVPLQSTE